MNIKDKILELLQIPSDMFEKELSKVNNDMDRDNFVELVKEELKEMTQPWMDMADFPRYTAEISFQDEPKYPVLLPDHISEIQVEDDDDDF